MAEAVAHKRFIKNFIVARPMQTRMSYYFAAFAICLIGVMIFILNHYLSQIRTLIVAAPLPMATTLEVEGQLYSVMVSSLIFLGIALVLAVGYSIIISHRIAGPMFAIMKYIETLRAGKYDEARRLRPYDELSPIMDALHDLASDLNKKK